MSESLSSVSAVMDARSVARCLLSDGAGVSRGRGRGSCAVARPRVTAPCLAAARPGPRQDARARLLSRAGGRVLEVGVGTGLNLRHYRRGAVTAIDAVDLSPGMLDQVTCPSGSRAASVAPVAWCPVAGRAETVPCAPRPHGPEDDGKRSTQRDAASGVGRRGATGPTRPTESRCAAEAFACHRLLAAPRSRPAAAATPPGAAA